MKPGPGGQATWRRGRWGRVANCRIQTAQYYDCDGGELSGRASFEGLDGPDCAVALGTVSEEKPGCLCPGSIRAAGSGWSCALGGGVLGCMGRGSAVTAVGGSPPPSKRTRGDPSPLCFAPGSATTV